MEEEKEVKGFEFLIEAKDVTDRVHFGSFEIILCKQGALFKNYSGYRVFTTPYVVGIDGKAYETSLYKELVSIVRFKQSIEGIEDEMFEGTTATNGRMLEGMKIVVESNLIKPQTVFTDYSEAESEAVKYVAWLNEKTKILSEAINKPVQDEDIKADMEFEYKQKMSEVAKEIIDEQYT